MPENANRPRGTTFASTVSFFVRVALLGGFACWVPSIVQHVVRRDSFSGFDVLALTGFLPFLAIVTTLGIGRVTKDARRLAATPLAIGLGLWLLGPLAMFISATPDGGGFAAENPWFDLLILSATFPLTTFMMATYDGTLGGLLFATVALAFMFRRRTAQSS